MNLIVCFACAERLNGGLPLLGRLAFLGPYDPSLMDVLVTVEKGKPHMEPQIAFPPCDGCGKQLQVSASSRWFYERWLLQPKEVKQ